MCQTAGECLPFRFGNSIQQCLEELGLQEAKSQQGEVNHSVGLHESNHDKNIG